jgi:hypothetical protein
MLCHGRGRWLNTAQFNIVGMCSKVCPHHVIYTSLACDGELRCNAVRSDVPS